MGEPDIIAETNVVENLGCAIAAWGEDSLVIQYYEPGQRIRLIAALRPLGWTDPVNDPGDIDAMLLDIRHAPAIKPSASEITLQAQRSGIYALAVIITFLIACTFVHGTPLPLKLALLLLAAFIAYIGLEYATLRIRLTPQEITLASALKTVALRVSDIHACAIEKGSASGAPILNIFFLTKKGDRHHVPAPFKGFQNLKDELRQRYSFTVS